MGAVALVWSYSVPIVWACDRPMCDFILDHGYEAFPCRWCRAVGNVSLTVNQNRAAFGDLPAFPHPTGRICCFCWLSVLLALAVCLDYAPTYPPYPFNHEQIVLFPSGISTTAGHDNLYEQSYPIVLNETMGSLMAAAGVRYEAINVAMGNTRVAPYSLCVDAHAGLEADIISWDMVRCRLRRASVRLAKLSRRLAFGL